MATVLIIGASRGIGLETVKATLKAGHSVRALARSARRIPIDHPKFEKMAGDALEMATVKRALTGVDVVAQSLGVSPGPELILKPTRFFSKATRVLGSSQAVDLRDGLRGWQQPRPRWISL
jgi:NAD(P)-dependent dehydrogenase (short-subunit alcohol dehydrogenase family)